MNRLNVRAPAKINFFLKVLRKRKDGYHDIYSWLQAVNLFDYLIFKKRPAGDLKLFINGGGDLPADDRNLVIKSVKLLRKKFELSGGLEIRLTKNIPIAAGLGGGSSDAAATIYAVNRLYNLGLTVNDMLEIGLQLGSDIPFFFSSGQAEVTGRGEVINNISLPIDYSIVLVVPGMAVSTGDSYRQLNFDLTSPYNIDKLKDCKIFTELVARIRPVGNDLEDINPGSRAVLGEIRNALKRTGAALVRMSGSGPAMFGLYKSTPITSSLRGLTGRGWYVFFGQPITLPAWEPVNDNRTFGREELS
jgi:4-diphosphocytidyl-2-C-methyl-D-erythritol kinase